LQLAFLSKPAAAWQLLALLAFILFFKLGASPIYILDEAKNAQCAREMLQRNDWVVPTFNGELRTDKPVLHYYFMMVAYKIFGVTEFAARFFSAVFGWLTGLLVYFFVKKFLGALAAFCSALVLVASTQFLFEFRLSVPDPYLIFFVAGGLMSAYTYLAQGQSRFLFLAAASFGLATLAKGPVAIALPGLCLLVWIIWQKKWKLVLTWQLFPAIALLAAITLPWYLAVDKATKGAWTRGFFIDHNVNRFSDPQEGHGGYFFITLLFVLLGLLPFTAYAVELFKNRRSVFAQPLVQFSGIVAAAFIIFFSIASTRLPNYPMPCYPFIAVIAGYYLSQVLQGVYPLKKYGLYIVLAVTLLLSVGAFFALRQEVEASYIAWVALLLLAGSVALTYVVFYWKNWTVTNRTMYLFGGYTIFNMLLLHVVYPVVYKQNPVAKTIEMVKAHQPLFAYEIYNPGYNFYLNTPIKRFYSMDSLRLAIGQNPQSLVITRTAFDDTLSALRLRPLASHHDLFENPTTIIYAPPQQP